MDSPFARHVHARTIVLPAQRVLFVPIPKAGCTSVLWRLAGVAGLGEEHFSRSTAPEVSPALTVHDMTLWPPEHRFADHGEDARRRMLSDDGWLRFSLVRHPATRLWSAWQSKLLLREPRFVQAFGDEPWFPAPPETPQRMLGDFRRFVAAVGTGAAADVHWAVQRELAGQLPLTHVGRVERLADTLALLRAHLGDDAWADEPARANRTPLPLAPGAYDGDAAAMLRDRHGPDFEAFGYDPREHAGAAPGALDAWCREVAPLLPLLEASAAEHARVGQLLHSVQRLQRRAQKAERTAAQANARRVGASRSRTLVNREGHAEHDVHRSWADGALEPGFTAVLRVKDEARSLGWTLPPLLRAVRRVVLVDNGSTDGTAALAQRIAAEAGAADRLEVHRYPYAVARCGADHLATRADSVHSLAYFYNWSFAHVRTSYALKWDGDMVLSDEAVDTLRDLDWQLEAEELVIRVPRHPLYLAADGRAFLDTAMRNCEPWAWPNRPGYGFVKAMEWELPLWGGKPDTLTLPEWSALELKHLDADEFTHWSDTAFDRSARTRRKQREWEVFRVLRDGAGVPPGVAEIVAPQGADVVAHARARLAARLLEPAG